MVAGALAIAAQATGAGPASCGSRTAGATGITTQASGAGPPCLLAAYQRCTPAVYVLSIFGVDTIDRSTFEVTLRAIAARSPSWARFRSCPRSRGPRGRSLPGHRPPWRRHRRHRLLRCRAGPDRIPERPPLTDGETAMPTRRAPNRACWAALAAAASGLARLPATCFTVAPSGDASSSTRSAPRSGRRSNGRRPGSCWAGSAARCRLVEASSPASLDFRDAAAGATVVYGIGVSGVEAGRARSTLSWTTTRHYCVSLTTHTRLPAEPPIRRAGSAGGAGRQFPRAVQVTARRRPAGGLREPTPPRRHRPLRRSDL